MNALFGKKKTAQEQAKESKREIRDSTRGIEKDLRALTREEQELEKQIKAHAAKGDMATARTLGKQLLRAREQKARMVGTKAQMQAVSTRTTTMAAQQKQMETFGVATKTMGAMNAQVDPMAMQQICQQFAMENQKSDMAMGMMDDALDDLDDCDIDEETAAVMDQVLDEVSLQIKHGAGVGATKLSAPSAAALPSSSTAQHEHA